MKNRRHLSFAASLASGVLVLNSTALFAAVATYTGPGGTDTAPATGNWNDPANWSEGLPASSLDTTLAFGGSTTGIYTATNNFGGDFNLNRLLLTSSSSGLATISGGSLNFLTDSLAAGPRITQDGSGAFTIASGIKLGNALTIDGTGSGLLWLSGVISGANSLTFNNSAGILRLGANTYSGGTVLTAGTLQAGSNTAVGTGTLSLNGGRFSSDSTTGRSLANALSIGGNVALGDITNNGGLTLSGATTLATANAVLTTDSAVNLSGIIGGGTNGFTKSGTGTLTLSNAGNTYTGLTTVNAGTLALNAIGTIKGNVLVTDTGILATTSTTAFGTAAATNSNVTIENGGIWNFSPGTTQAVKTLTLGNAADTSGTPSRVEMGNSSGSTSTLQITGLGANILNLQGSATTPAILSLGGYGLGIGTINFTHASPGTTTTVNLGANSQIHSGGLPAGSGNGALYSTATTTASNYVSFNFNGTTISTLDYTGATSGPGSLYYNLVRVGDSNGQTAGYFNNVNLNAGLGDGTGLLQVVKSNLNLGWTGSINLGALIAARDGNTTTGTATTPTTNSNPVTVLNTATGMTGGVIYGAGTLASGPGVSGGFTSLTFQTAGAPQTFTLGTDTSGDNPVNNIGTIDVRTRNSHASAGVITQNNISLLIDGGILRGNALAASTAGITLSNGGELTLSADTAAYTISTSGIGANNRTIYMNGSGAGTFTLGGAGTSVISIATQTGAGTWSGGTINANRGHTISDGTGGISTTTTAGFLNGYALAANSGLNGIAMNNTSPFATTASGVTPTTAMTLASGSSFLAKNSATALNPFTYFIGETATLAGVTPATSHNVGIAVPDSGSFMFGMNQANNTQASLGATAVSYSGGSTASITLPADAGTTYGLSEGGTLQINSTSGTNAAFFNGTFIITGISGSTVTFALNSIPPSITAPATSSATIRKNQTMVLLRDKGADNISLLANTVGGNVRIAENQSGSGNLYVNANGITLAAGTSFSGTGGIYSGTVVPGSGWTNLGGDTLGESNIGAYGSINGSSSTDTLFIVNGALGTSAADNFAVSLNAYHSGTNGGTSGIVLGDTATLAGTQSWTVYTGTSNYRQSPLFANRLTNASAWDANVSLRVQGHSGLIEASTSTAAPSTTSNYRFNSLTLQGVGGAHVGNLKLTNNAQNDGGSGKEAFYAGTITTSFTDGSGGTVLLNLNGQDLFYDQFTPTTGKALSVINDAAGSTSVIRNLGNLATSAPLVVGGFRVLNGSTIQTQAGDWYSMMWNRNVGNIVADTAAAPNAGNGENSKQALGADNTNNGSAASFMNFLGSGTATGGNTGTTAAGTDGTFRVIGGKFQASNYTLNPVGTVGTIDTTGGSDTTLNDVIIRGNASQAVTTADGSTFLTLGTQQLYSVGDMVHFASAGGGFSASGVNYYVVGVNGNQVQLSTTPGGSAQAAVGALSGTLQDPQGAGITGGTAATPGLIAAGTTNIVGNLIMANAPNAAYQATLRVGGVDPATGLAHASPGTLNVTGNLTVGATNNLAVQSNGTVKVGGNVDILGVGSNYTVTVNSVPVTPTGTGVGFNAQSHFTLNGNQGAGTPQMINIAPSVANLGNFHVGDGSSGILTGTAAQARLAANLTVATSADINGAASRLNLGGFTLTANGSGLTVGGMLAGNGTVAGSTTFISGSALNPGNSPGLITFNDAVTFESGSAINIEINGATTRGTDYDGVNFNGGLTVNGGTLTFNFGSTIADDTILSIFNGAALTPTFTSIVASGSYSGSLTYNGSDAYSATFGAQTITFDLASGDLSFTAATLIPEPSAYAAFAALAACAVALVRRRRYRS